LGVKVCYGDLPLALQFGDGGLGGNALQFFRAVSPKKQTTQPRPQKKVANPLNDLLAERKRNIDSNNC